VSGVETLDARVVGSTRITAVRADITRLAVDVVVNAANEFLAHGGGVAAAIARAGAPDVDAESHAWVRTNGRVGRGQAAVTSAGPMPSGHVVHVVGPRYREGQDNQGLLAEATTTALDAAAGLGADSVAIPAISAGVFGYPADAAAAVIAAAVAAWAHHHEQPGQVLLVGHDREMAQRFADAISALAS